MSASSRLRAYIRQHHVALLALFFALAGGTAYATHPGGANTISTEDIINGQVQTPDIGAAAVVGTRLAGNSVNSSKAVNNSLTGADVDESSLDLTAEAWHEIGSGSPEPDFGFGPNCVWSNFDSSHNSAAFLRDRQGFVHLKGLVKVIDNDPADCDNFDDFPGSDPVIFRLPSGYRPAKRAVFATITNAALGRVNVDGPGNFSKPSGAVSVDPPTTLASAKQWLSLDGIRFRCAPSGADGCP